MGFSFTATAQCDACGQLLSSSDEDCDHEGKPVEKHIFRRLGEGRDSLVGVKSTPQWKWFSLKEKIGNDDWIAYQYIGRKETVNAMLSKQLYRSVEDIPTITMSCQAPDGIDDHDVE